MAAVALAWDTGHRLALRHAPPASALPSSAAFAVAAALAFAGGRAAGRGDRSPDTAPELGSCSGIRIAFAGVALVSILATWVLQREPPPRLVLATWAAALVALPFAFPKVRRTKTGTGRFPAWAGVLGAVVFAVAAWARLANLGDIPPVFSGDESNQVFDGRDWLQSASPSDPFGTGWIGTIRLGMLPAGIGGSLAGSPVAGPRFPYAVAGTLSVAAAAVAAAAVAGPLASVGCLAFLALAPHHLHFSRLASVQVLDSLFGSLAIALLFLVRRTCSPRVGALAGIASGLSLYGYAGGRVVAVVFVVATIGLLLSRRWPGRLRRWVVLALAAGFLTTAGPNLRFAARHFDDWNGRFNQVSVFQKGWLDMETERLGSLARVAGIQLRDGTLGLFFADDSTPWFTGHPMVPPLLAGAAIAGAGWLAGQQRAFAFVLLAVAVAGNLAGTVLTTNAPAPQRISSLLPALAILAGVAFAGLVSIAPERGESGVPWRPAVAALAAGTLLAAAVRGYPLDSEPHAAYGGPHAALAQGAERLLSSPRFAGKPVHLHGWRYLDSTFPSFRYFLPGTRFIDDDPNFSGYTEKAFPPGLHLFSSEWVATAKDWQRRLGLAHGIPIAHPAFPSRDVGYLLVVPR